MTRYYFSLDLFETWCLVQGASQSDLVKQLSHWSQYEGKSIEAVKKEELIALREWFTTKEEK